MQRPGEPPLLTYKHPRSHCTPARAKHTHTLAPRPFTHAPRPCAGILRWDVLDAAASRINNIPVLSRYTLRPGQKPASAPGSTLPTQ